MNERNKISNESVIGDNKFESIKKRIERQKQLKDETIDDIIERFKKSMENQNRKVTQIIYEPS